MISFFSIHSLCTDLLIVFYRIQKKMENQSLTIVKPPAKIQTRSSDNQSTTQSFRNLKTWHQIAMVLHGVQALIALIVVVVRKDSPIPIYTTEYSVFNSDSPTILNVYSMYAEYLIVAFFFMAATDHAFCVYYWEDSYEELVRMGNGYYCWIEFSVSAPLMNVVILTLCGGLDIWIQLFVAFGTGLTMFFGWLVEATFSEVLQSTYFNTIDLIWFFLSVGFIPFGVVWSSIFYYFHFHSSSAPKFVWALVILLFILECLFPLNLFLFIRRERSLESMEKYEKGKIALSLLSKSLLAWIVLGGLLAQSTAP